MDRIINILSLVLGIVSLGYAFYSTHQLTKGMKIGALQHIRFLINRMEEEKGKQPPDSTQWRAMHHTQQDLESLFNNLQKMFSIPDNQAPH